MAKKKSKAGRDARRAAHLQRLQANAGSAGEARRDRERTEAEREAAASPSAARWLVAGATGGRALDVGQIVAAMPVGIGLQGRGSDELRSVAADVAELMQLGAVCPSGELLLHVIVEVESDRDALGPSFDLSALLGGDAPRETVADRTVRVAHLLRGHAGTTTLHAAVAPPAPRHPRADEVEALVLIATTGLRLPASAAPAVSTAEGGWVAASPYELFLTAARGIVEGGASDVVGEILATWLGTWVHGRDDWASALPDVTDAAAAELLQQAAARAGSDHPRVVAPVVVDLIALRHPLHP